MSTDQKYTLGFALILAIIGFIASGAALGRTWGLDAEVSAIATRVAETEDRLMEVESRPTFNPDALHGLNQFINDQGAEIAVLRAEMDTVKALRLLARQGRSACLTELWRVAPCEPPAPTPSPDPIGELPLCYSVFPIEDWTTYCALPDVRMFDAMLWCMRWASTDVPACMGIMNLDEEAR